MNRSLNRSLNRLWRLAAVLCILLTLLPVVKPSPVSAQEEYEEILFVVPLDTTALNAVSSDAIAAAALASDFVTIRARLFNRSRRLDVSVTSPTPFENLTVTIRRNDNLVFSGVVDAADEWTTVFNQSDAYEYGDMLDIRAETGDHIVSEVIVEALEASPVHVWLLLDSEHCLRVIGHNDPEILVRVLAAGTDRVLKEEHFTRKNTDWEVLVNAGVEAERIDVQVVVSSKWKDDKPAGTIRSNYSFLDVKNPCFIAPSRCSSVQTEPAQDSHIEPNTLVRAFVNTEGADYIQLYSGNGTFFTPLTESVAVTGAQTEIEFAANPGLRYLVATTNERGTEFGCPFGFTHVPMPLCNGTEFSVAPGSVVVPGQIITGTISASDTSTAQLYTVRNGQPFAPVTDPLDMTAGSAYFQFAVDQAEEEYMFVLANSRGTVHGCYFRFNMLQPPTCLGNDTTPASGSKIVAGDSISGTAVVSGASSVQIVSISRDGQVLERIGQPYQTDFLKISIINYNFTPVPGEKYALELTNPRGTTIGCPIWFGEHIPARCNEATMTIDVANRTMSVEAKGAGVSWRIKQENVDEPLATGYGITASAAVSVSFPAQYWVEWLDEAGVPGEVAESCKARTWAVFAPIITHHVPAPACQSVSSSLPDGAAIHKGGELVDISFNVSAVQSVRLGGSELAPVDGWVHFKEHRAFPGQRIVPEVRGFSGDWQPAPQCSIAFTSDATEQRGFGNGDPYWCAPVPSQLEGDLDSSDLKVAPQKTACWNEDNHQTYKVSQWQLSYKNKAARWAYANFLIGDWGTLQTDFYKPDGQNFQAHTRAAGKHFRVRNLATKVCQGCQLTLDLYKEGGPSYAWGSEELKHGVAVDGWLIKSMDFQYPDGRMAQALTLIRNGVEVWLVQGRDGWGHIDIVRKAGSVQLGGFMGVGMTGQIGDPNQYVAADLFGTAVGVAASSSNEAVVIDVDEANDWTDDFPAAE